MNSAHAQHSHVVPFRAHTGPCHDILHGLEGFYVLSGRGELGRCNVDGRFCEEPALTRELAPRIKALLRQYRWGDVRGLAIGLITGNTADRPRRSASLVFSDAALREVFRTGQDLDVPLTAFQKRNKVQSLPLGMDIVLDSQNASQPRHPRFCPVLFTPEGDKRTLCRRYDLDDNVLPGQVFEVLDVLASCTAEERRQPALDRMMNEMRQSMITPELHQSSELMLLEETETGSFGTDRLVSTDVDPWVSPWEDEPGAHDTSFDDGDPVRSWLLARFTPFNELNELQRQFIARGHKIVKKLAGTILLERGSQEDVSFYLIGGTLELKAFDRRGMSIVGGTHRANLPISQLRPHAYTVKAATEVTVIPFSQEMLREITRIKMTYRNRSGIEVIENASLLDNIKCLASASNEVGQTPRV